MATSNMYINLVDRQTRLSHYSAPLHCKKNTRISTDIVWRFLYFNGTGSVKMQETRHKISVDIRIFYSVSGQSKIGMKWVIGY